MYSKEIQYIVRTIMKGNVLAFVRVCGLILAELKMLIALSVS